MQWDLCQIKINTENDNDTQIINSFFFFPIAFNRIILRPTYLRSVEYAECILNRRVKLLRLRKNWLSYVWNYSASDGFKVL